MTTEASTRCRGSGPPSFPAAPVCILDCGCGSAHLTFGTFHYLNNVLGVPARILGVDTNAVLMQRSNEYWWAVLGAMHC